MITCEIRILIQLCRKLYKLICKEKVSNVVTLKVFELVGKFDGNEIKNH